MSYDGKHISRGEEKLGAQHGQDDPHGSGGQGGGQEQDRQERGVPDGYVFDGFQENTGVDCRGESKNDSDHFQDKPQRWLSVEQLGKQNGSRKNNESENNERGEDEEPPRQPGGSRVQAGVEEPCLDSKVQDQERSSNSDEEGTPEQGGFCNVKIETEKGDGNLGFQEPEDKHSDDKGSGPHPGHVKVNGYFPSPYMLRPQGFGFLDQTGCFRSHLALTSSARSYGGNSKEHRCSRND